MDGPATVPAERRRRSNIGVASAAVSRSSILASPAPSASAAIVVDAHHGAERSVTAARPAFNPQIVGLLFADVRGFSALSDEEIPLFVERVLGTIAEELSSAPRPPLMVNTWGDGLYLVFESVRESGEFALELCERMRSADWRAMGLRHDLGLRIGLHAGPAYAFSDPITGRSNYIGAHVSRAARIEPITPPGEVYASQAFAALAQSEGVDSFACAYVGQTPLAKKYGSFPTYRGEPAAPPNRSPPVRRSVLLESPVARRAGCRSRDRRRSITNARVSTRGGSKPVFASLPPRGRAALLGVNAKCADQVRPTSTVPGQR